MISQLRRQITCRLGRHERSKSRARWDGDKYVSRCRHCLVVLERQPDGKWQVAAGNEPGSLNADAD